MPASSSTGSRVPKQLTFRPELNGQRGVAIALVVLGHLISEIYPTGSGGVFIAMDIFFVQSGFLITTLLIVHYHEQKVASGSRRKGSISLRGFYSIRALRILPAELLMIALVLLISRFTFNEIRFEQVQADALWTTFSAENLHLMAQSRDYFSSAAARSPLQHCWSLGIEEQFYIVWPLLLLLATRMKFLRKLPLVGGDWQRRILIVALTVGFASLVWSYIASESHPVESYFSPLTRAWVILVGAAIAAAPALRNGVAPRLSRIAILAGTGLILSAVAVVKTDTPYPGLIALLPAIGTGLLIVGGINAPTDSRMSRFFRTRLLSFTGRISYSLYLWHWPIIVFAAAIVPISEFGGLPRILALGALAMFVSWLSYRFVETPFRRLYKLKESVINSRGKWTGSDRDKFRIGALAASAVLTIAVIAIWARPVGDQVGNPAALAELASPFRDNLASSTAANAEAPAQSGDLGIKQWNQELGAAVRATHTSQHAIDLAGVGSAKGPAYVCGDISDRQKSIECSLGGAGLGGIHWPTGMSTSAVLVGSSLASQWRTTLALLMPRNVRLYPLTAMSCDPTRPEMPADQSSEVCAAHSRMVGKQIAQFRPGLAIVAFGGGDWQTDSPSALRSRITSLVQRLKLVARKVLIISPAPPLASFDSCLIARSTLVTACNKQRVPALSANDWRLAAAVRQAGGSYLSGTEMFCRRTVCPAFVNNRPVRYDWAHLTGASMYAVRGSLRGALAAALR